MNIEFHPHAREELRAAAILYERTSAGLGRDLIREVRRVTERIRDLPRSGSPESALRRVVRLKRFPFKLVYREKAEALIVVAVAHERRHPDYWQERG